VTLRSAAGRALGVREAYEALDQYGQEHGEVPLLLMLHAAVPQSFRVDMLNLMKANFLALEAGVDMTVDADVLLSPLVEANAAGYYRLDPEVRRHCLELLDARYRSQSERRSTQVARFVLAYADMLERKVGLSLDPLIDEFLSIQRWVAASFIEPERAAQQFALILQSAETQTDPAARVRLSSMTAALSIPLAGHQPLLAYARGLDALARGDKEQARRDMEILGDDDLNISGVVLKRPKALQLAGATRISSDAPSEFDAQPQQAATNEAVAPNRRPMVFLSYDSADSAAAERIRQQLTDADIDIDPEAVGSSINDIGRRFIARIDRCDFFLALMSENAVKSELCRLEWGRALGRYERREPGKRFFLPLIVDDSVGLRDQTPPELQLVQWGRAPRGELDPDFIAGLKRDLDRESPLPPFEEQIGLGAERIQEPGRREEAAPTDPPDGVPGPEVGRVPSTEGERVRILLSYARADIAAMKRVRDTLREHEAVVFEDADLPGESFSPKVTSEIANCDVFVPLVSRASVESPWCLYQWREAIALRSRVAHPLRPSLSRHPRIIPVQTDEASSYDDERVPAELRQFIWRKAPQGLLSSEDVLAITRHPNLGPGRSGTERPWAPPDPPPPGREIRTLDPRVEHDREAASLPSAIVPPPPVGWELFETRDATWALQKWVNELMFNPAEFPVGTFVQSREFGPLVAARVEWREQFSSEGVPGVRRTVQLMMPTDRSLEPTSSLPESRTSSLRPTLLDEMARRVIGAVLSGERVAVALSGPPNSAIFDVAAYLQRQEGVDKISWFDVSNSPSNWLGFANWVVETTIGTSTRGLGTDSSSMLRVAERLWELTALRQRSQVFVFSEFLEQHEDVTRFLAICAELTLLDQGPRLLFVDAVKRTLFTPGPAAWSKRIKPQFRSETDKRIDRPFTETTLKPIKLNEMCRFLEEAVASVTKKARPTPAQVRSIAKELLKAPILTRLAVDGAIQRLTKLF
jgi:hypothetical protein